MLMCDPLDESIWEGRIKSDSDNLAHVFYGALFNTVAAHQSGYRPRTMRIASLKQFENAHDGVHSAAFNCNRDALILMWRAGTLATFMKIFYEKPIRR